MTTTQIKVTTRGNEVKWEAIFLDFSDQPQTPDSAKVFLVFPGGSADLDMQNNSGTWSAIWDSKVAIERGCVTWSVRSVNPGSAADGYFELSANAANPDP